MDPNAHSQDPKSAGLKLEWYRCQQNRKSRSKSCQHARNDSLETEFLCLMPASCPASVDVYTDRHEEIRITPYITSLNPTEPQTSEHVRLRIKKQIRPKVPNLRSTSLGLVVQAQRKCQSFGRR